MAEEAVETPLASLARVVSKATAQFFLPPLSLTAFFAGKIFSVVWRLENLGNPRARKNQVIPASLSILLGKTIFFPAKYLVTHGRTLPAARFLLPSQVLFP